MEQVCSTFNRFYHVSVRSTSICCCCILFLHVRLVIHLLESVYVCPSVNPPLLSAVHACIHIIHSTRGGLQNGHFTFMPSQRRGVECAAERTPGRGCESRLCRCSATSSPSTVRLGGERKSRRTEADLGCAALHGSGVGDENAKSDHRPLRSNKKQTGYLTLFGAILTLNFALKLILFRSDCASAAVQSSCMHKGLKSHLLLSRHTFCLLRPRQLRLASAEVGAWYSSRGLALREKLTKFGTNAKRQHISTFNGQQQADGIYDTAAAGIE
ncbi:unnamed protein product [Protopolystoma xenopodis]|uniref:Uncharacterized protein n=1 Tax=Protopolystoma xenopodis TaxID=117903 RepID=A0A3S5CPQ5_9PLAT|nr:unnamed protein product [Protopolystoma xenopodis]